MTLHSFLNVVPRPVRLSALLGAPCVSLIGIVAGYFASAPAHHPRDLATYSLAALVLGAFLAVWLLGIGFVFGDARLRAMRPRLWVLVVIFFPHLLGFLLYLVMRQPLASPCIQCGQPTSPTQRFCPSCGASQIPSAAGGSPISAAVRPEASR